MLIILGKSATREQINQVVEKLEKSGYSAHISEGVEKTVIGAVGIVEEEELLMTQMEAFPFVEKVLPVLKPYKLVQRDFKPEKTVVVVNGVKVGGDEIVVIAGPCAVESEEQLISTAEFVKSCGAKMLRGGAFKPRTSPYSFMGMQKEGLKLLQKAKKITGLPIVTEVMDTRDIDLVGEYADVLQVGARNMQNFFLLRELGKIRKPVLLKRGLSATIEELLMAAEYIMAGGNYNVILCERGIRTYETATRNTMDLSMVPIVKELSHLPVITDPSHGTGVWKIVTAMSCASIAVGADGIIVEVHPSPQDALSDGAQSLNFENFKKLMQEIKPIIKARKKKI